MRYAKLHIGDNSVLSLTQNEVNSIVYLLQGSVEIENLAGKSTVLAPKQKLVISRSDASNDDVDLSLQKTQIDEYFIGSDWFIRNHGLQYLTAEASATGTTDTVSMSSKIVTLDTIQDEARVSSASIDVKGKYTVETVRAIKINGKNAEMDTGAKTFTVSGVDTSKKENDLVVKVYGADDELIAKYVYTVYYDSAASSATSTDLFKVENFSLDSTKFKFISPTTNPYTTTASMVTIEGMVPANTVAKILVNDFQLQKFPKNGTYWKYHANVEWGNLKPGLNIYKVDYYGNNGELLHSNAFTIVKPAATPAPAAVTPKEESSPISGEA
ncbi:MAG: hypothetical protein H6767_09395 [Candidatus Peribacteria bacterium]|nr:MAG: hypothetical protein H6767_09395 [Candidatus Peribacteria bacterium]